MYVCICNGITTSVIQEVSKKAKTFKDVVKACGACTNCGCCKKEVKRVFNETKQST